MGVSSETGDHTPWRLTLKKWFAWPGDLLVISQWELRTALTLHWPNAGIHEEEPIVHLQSEYENVFSYPSVVSACLVKLPRARREADLKVFVILSNKVF